MNDLNLLPSEAKFLAERMRLKAIINNFIWIFGGLWLSLIVVMIGLNLIFQLNLNQLNKKYQKVSDQYKSLAGNMAVNQKVRYQAKVVAKVLNNRFEYGESIERVKNIFSDKIVIKNFKISEKKKFEIEGMVVDGKYLEEVEKKIVDINSAKIEGFKSVELKNIEVKGTDWFFSMEVTLI